MPGTYALNVTQLATQGSATGTAAAGLVITAGVNDELTLRIDGVDATVTLNAATYASVDALAAEVESRINAAAALAGSGASVTVRQSGGVLAITSVRYGSVSAVSASGSAAGTLFGGAAVEAAGVDAAGTLDGQLLLASGQTLRGFDGTPFEGLALLVSGGPLGGRGTVTLQTGFAYRLNELLKGVLGSDGAVATRTEGLQRDIADIAKRRDTLTARLALVEANYRAQFNALDTLLANLSAQSTALQQQLDNLPKLYRSA